MTAHIIRYAALFLSSTALRVSDIDYSNQVTEPAAMDFVKRHYDKILHSTRLFLGMMDSGKILVTHDFYLKKFQLSNPVLNYDCILLDEGQDASPVMLDVFLKQHADKVIVGDAHQQIYAWRHAVNALGSVNFDEYGLTTSFRFPQRIADCAMECLLWKHHLYGDEYKPVTITGAGTPSKKINSRATLARTNIFLLRNAIDLVCGAAKPAKIYFEGNLSSYTYASEGASLWDVFNLFSHEPDKIRDPLIKSMSSIDELEEYATEAEDAELGMLIDMVNEHGRRLPWFFKQIKEHHVTEEKRHTADMVLSTVHRCKGMEYDWVKLEEDFLNETQLKKVSAKKDLAPADKIRLEEEINVVYVALTRARNVLGIPEKLFQFSPEGILTGNTAGIPAKQGTAKSLPVTFRKDSDNSDFLVHQRQKHPKAYRPWDAAEDALLGHLVLKKMQAKKIALQLNRSRGAILARIEKLELT
jgi:superfamily I DNA/RNA helicase